jgi:DNA replication factor GINS
MTENYRVLLDAWEKERHRPDLQPLPEGFFALMSEYTSRLRGQAEPADTTSLRGRLMEKERRYADTMLQEIAQLRLRKIVLAELENMPLESTSLTAEEKRLQVDLRRLLSAHSQELRQALLGEARPQEAERPPAREERPAPAYKVVRFLQSLPSIMGVDMKTYGPFKAEDVASLPLQNSENLIRRGIAKEVETKP